jgi:hypothetical protein
MLPFAPGSRAVIRDEEWLIRRIDPSADGGWLLSCDGISDLVRGQSALFLTALEDTIEVLDPAKTELVPDTSPTYNATVLYLESLRRRSVANDDKIHLGHRGVMNLVPYQLDPALQALKQPRSRILIADSVGLGKTLEAGILATELIQRGRGKRILVVTQKAMLTQFQKEWWSRFSIPLVRLDSVGLARVRNRIPANHNPFNYFDRSIISIDTLKSNLEYRNYLENAWWDIIVIDECHNVAARAGESGLSRRARLARLLSNRSDTLMLLSATPHDGSARSFASLMSLLDPTAIPTPTTTRPTTSVARAWSSAASRKTSKTRCRPTFQERQTICLRQPASAQEEAAYRALLDVAFTQGGQHKAGRQQELQRISLQKGLFSSPAAALESTLKRMELLSNKSSPSKRTHRSARSGRTGLQPAGVDHRRRRHQLQQIPAPAGPPALARLRLENQRRRRPPGHLLRAHRNPALAATAACRRPEDQAQPAGRAAWPDGRHRAARTGRALRPPGRPLRVLLCSDVASEGLNLHYFCHRLVHFDLPWSLMVFQQRNGRVDRYGQKHQPQIVYLFTEATVTDKIKGDLRILEILAAKDEQANLNLGDPSAFLNVFDPDKEVEKVADFMAQGMSPEQVETRLDTAASEEDDNEGDYLLSLFGGDEAPAPVSSTAQIDEPTSLFDSDYHYTKTALTQLNQVDTLCQWTAHDAEQIIALTAPRDLQERLKQLPREVQADNDLYSLCASPERMAAAIETARQARAEDDTWPQLHYLWPQHPIMDWIGDRVLTHFGRHRAPLLQSGKLQPQEQAFILMSMVPNRKGQPLLVEWQVAHRIGNGPFALESFDAFATRAGLRANGLPNRGHTEGLDATCAAMQQALPMAVEAMHAHMLAKQAIFANQLSERLQGTLAELERLQGRQVQQLTLELEKQLETVKRGRFEQRSQQINRVFDDYRQWVQDTLTTEPQPWIQVLAAVCHPQAALAATAGA